METQNNTQEIQTEQKTKAGHSIIGIAAVCLAAIVLAALLVPTIRWRVYPGDRVKGVVTVTIDGEPAAIVEDTLCSSYNKLENKTEFRVEGNALQVSTRANKYGGYDFAFDVEELPDMKFNFYAFQFNWWNVTDFELVYNVNTKEGIVQYRAVHTELKESGFRSEPIVWEDSYPLEEHWTEVCICSP